MKICILKTSLSPVFRFGHTVRGNNLLNFGSPLRKANLLLNLCTVKHTPARGRLSACARRDIIGRICQQTLKNFRNVVRSVAKKTARRPRLALQPFQVPERKFSIVHIDLVSFGHDRKDPRYVYALRLVDRWTRFMTMCHLLDTTTKAVVSAIEHN